MEMKKTIVRGWTCKLIVRSFYEVSAEQAERFRVIIREEILEKVTPDQINPKKIAREIHHLLGDKEIGVSVRRNRKATVWRATLRR